MKLFRFNKKIICYIVLLVFYSTLFCDEVSEIYDIGSNTWYKNNEENGYIMFSGFSFDGYEPETDGLEPMLEKTLELLEEHYGESKQPFVFVGHSQGGLRALAMSTYLKEKNPELYKQLRGVITISGIDRGLELLENRGATFRARLSEDIRILSDGIVGIVKVFTFVPGDFLEDLIFGYGTKDVTGLALEQLTKLLLGSWCGTSRFAYPIIWNSSWDEYAQVRDMVPQSDFIKKYVLEETKNTYSYVDYNDYTNKIEWRKKWGWLPYPVIVKQYKTKYVYKTAVDMKVDKDLPMKFLAGTVSDTMDMDSTVDIGVTVGLHTAGLIYGAAGTAHVVKCAALFGFLTNSVMYADDCFKAASWCFNYKDEISEILGGPVHDGLVTEDYQQLPTHSEVDMTNLRKVLNNTETKEFSHLNHKNMNDLTEKGKTISNSAKAYANQTVEEWLK